MEHLPQNKPFQFKKNKRNRFTEQSQKYYRKIALEKMKDKKRLRRIVKLRRIHLQRYISVKYKGGKWWDKLMKLYFGEVTHQEILNCKENTTSQIMLNFGQYKTRPRSYAQIFIFKDYLQLAANNILKFLFRGIIDDQDVYELLIYEYKFKAQQQEQEDCYILNPKAASLPSPQKLATIRVENIQEEYEIRAAYRANVSLMYVTSIRDMDVVDSCLDYQQVYRQCGYNHIKCQLTLLSNKLQQIHEENHRLWDKIIKAYQQQITMLQNLRQWQSEIVGLQTRLACRDRMLFFKKGFSNKTQDQLQQALQQLQLEQKRLIYSRRVKKSNRLASYNDCKICFDPEVRETNYIVFCTACYVSYHINCYGLKSVEKAQLYVCDACLQMEKKDLDYDDSYMRPTCQICYSKKQFPLKEVQKHFYHVTCLYFYNIGLTKSFEIEVKQSSIEQISKNVKQNMRPRCAYCLPESIQNGLTLQCRKQGCEYHFHPLCAYLRGCQFQILRLQQLKIAVKCHLHTYFGDEDEQIRQVYIRRFFCNYKNIQKLNEQQFKPLYRDEIMQIQMELKKIERDEVDWRQYDTIKKKQRNQKYQERQHNMEKYRLMTIEQLLQVAASPPKEREAESQFDQLDAYQEAEDAQLFYEDSEK